MPQPLIREINLASGRFLENGKEVEYTWSAIYKRFDVDGVIRIQNEDFLSLPQSGPFTHFNLEVADHRAGARYLLIRIHTPGYFVSRSDERLPLLDLGKTRTGLCLSSKGFLRYDDLSPEDFQFSPPLDSIN